MKEHVKYATARNQLYHLALLWHRTLEEAKVLHPTPQYRQAVDMATAVFENARDAFERGNVLEVLINEYVPTPLPGFEEYVTRMSQAIKDDLPLTDEERKELDQRTHDLLAKYAAIDPFEGKADWDTQGSAPPAEDWFDIKAEEDFIRHEAGADDEEI